MAVAVVVVAVFLKHVSTKLSFLYGLETCTFLIGNTPFRSDESAGTLILLIDPDVGGKEGLDVGEE